MDRLLGIPDGSFRRSSLCGHAVSLSHLRVVLKINNNGQIVGMWVYLSADAHDQAFLWGGGGGGGHGPLMDAIKSLQTISGAVPGLSGANTPDINGDGRIGLEEVIYTLQRAAGLRP